MKCHTGAVPVKVGNATRRVALIGMPNTGKSTLFNQITGARAHVANWPGITVDLLQAKIDLNHELVEFVDLPGIYDLNGFSEDEKVVQRFLENFAIDLLIVVLNASQIDRQIRLPLQVKALGLPCITLLNMSDEAKHYGVKINPAELSTRLGMPVHLISAKYARGIAPAMNSVERSLEQQENAFQVNDLKTHLAEQGAITPEQAQDVLNGAVQIPSELARNITTTLDAFLLHPIFGLPLFFAGMFLVFQLIWNVGLPSQDIMRTATDWIQSTILEPLLKPFPAVVHSFAIDGLWNGLSTVASFLPLLIVFFILMALLEDSGYLSRAAYLMDAFMAKLGLDGRGFVMQMMGFGCNVPAMMGTRVMRSRGLRLLTMLVIPFSLCSARLQVFVFILAAVFPNKNGAIALFALYVLSFVAAFATAFAFKGHFKTEDPFVLELPPYRLPTLKQALLRGWGAVREFLSRATGFITLGCVAVWLLTNLPPGTTGLATYGGQIGQFLSPIMAPIGINPYLTLALIFGFVAKEVVVGALPVIYGMGAEQVGTYIGMNTTFLQGFSFCIFCLLYTPCLSTVATQLSESKSWKFTLFSLGFSLVLAWVASFIFYQTGLALGFK